MKAPAFLSAACYLPFLIKGTLGFRPPRGELRPHWTSGSRQNGDDAVVPQTLRERDVKIFSGSSLEGEDKHVKTVLFVECGFGVDAHGQNSTKAAIRACRNAIEFNQISAIADIVPGGRDGMKLDVLVGVPSQYQEDLDLEPIRRCFPYGQVRIQVQSGGMVASSGKVIESLGDRNDDMVIVCVAVTVGY